MFEDSAAFTAGRKEFLRSCQGRAKVVLYCFVDGDGPMHASKLSDAKKVRVSYSYLLNILLFMHFFAS